MKLFLLLFFIVNLAFANGKLQDADFKTEADLVGAGADASFLLNTTKIYDPNLMKTLDDAINDGDIGTKLTAKGNLIGFGTSTDECVLDKTDGNLLTVDSTAVCGFDFKTPPVSTTLSAKGEIQAHNGTTNVAIPAPTSNGLFLVSDDSQDSGWRRSNQLQGVLNPVTDWEDITATANTSLLPTGLGSSTGTYSYYRKRQVGDTVHVEFRFNTTATVGSGSANVTFPLSPIPTSSTTNSGSIATFNVTHAESANVAFRTSTAIVSAVGATIMNQGTGGVIVGSNIGANAQIYGKFNYKATGLTSGLSAVVQNKTLTAEDDNYCSGFIPANGSAVFRENYSGCIGVTKISSGTYRLNYSAMSLSNTPSIIANSMDIGSGIICGQDNAFSNTLTETQVVCRNTSNSLTDTNFMYKITKVGNDYNKSKIIVGTFGNCQTKFLTADIGSNVVDILDLRFTNLEIGRNYILNMRPYYRFNVSDNMEFDAKTNGNTICRDTTGQSGGGYNTFKSTICHFTAQATTLIFDSRSVAATNLINGNGSRGETYIELCTSEKEF